MKKKKNIQPDDYFSNGIFEVARFGKNVVLHNTMTPDMHAKYLEFLAAKYDEKVELIGNLIEKIRENVLLCDAKNLMNFLLIHKQTASETAKLQKTVEITKKVCQNRRKTLTIRPLCVIIYKI